MARHSWPSDSELNNVRKIVSEMARCDTKEVRVVASPYRICPLGAHIDHQGGTVTAMTINKGILLGFVPSGSMKVVLRSGQFEGEVNFRIDEVRHLLPKHTDDLKNENAANDTCNVHEECSWGNYARGAVYALQSKQKHLVQGIIGYTCGSEGLDSSGLSSSAAVGVAYLLALETANNLIVPLQENIECDRIIENKYLGLKNGILDQSAILLSAYGSLLCMNCKTKKHRLVHPPKFRKNTAIEFQKAYKILLAFSGFKCALTVNNDYNDRVSQCQEAAGILLNASGIEKVEPLLSDVETGDYEAHKSKLDPILAKRAEHYFSENRRVKKGLEAWASGDLEDFGLHISDSGRSSIDNYNCGAKPMVKLYNILLQAPGIFGARFSGAGFRGCCLAFVDANHADEAASYVRTEYEKEESKLVEQMNKDSAVLICEAGDCARVI